MKDFTVTHHGLFLGILPVWLDLSGEEFCLEAKGGFIGDLAFSFLESLFGVFIFISSMVNPNFDPGYPVIITQEESKSE